MEYNEIAAVSGKSGLFRIVNPTRTGVILEALDGTAKKMVVNMSAKVSVLSDISIYTTDGEGSVPLEQVMKKIHKEFDGDTGLNGSSEPDELKSFIEFILPNYDESRVYVSDIKKVVNWYSKLCEFAPELLSEPKEDKESEKSEEKKDTKEKEG
jgi:hypothetical protein